MAGAELAPLPPAVQTLPSPRELAAVLRERLEAEIVRVRAERGDVHTPEDTHALIRALRGFQEMTEEYGRAFANVAKVAVQEIEEELKDAVTEAAPGIPLSGMNVPDTDGTLIKLALDNANSYEIDPSAVYVGLSELILHGTSLSMDVLNAAVACALGAGESEKLAAEFNASLAEALMYAMEQVGTVATVSLQVSKVRQLARLLGAAGRDQSASVVTSGIRKKATYKGVKITRAESK